MVEAADIVPLLERTLTRLEAFGVKSAILFSGHFAGEQIDMIRTLESSWQGHMRVRALAVNMPSLGLAPDHAALFETTLLSALWPDRVRLDLLGSAPAVDPEGNTMGPQRHDPSHPLYGVFGPDPREFDPAAAASLRDAMVDWLLGEVAAFERQTL
jgi:creatinine amidohydrolase